eukprot:1145600-Pleurochrysis_carterae.AAC.3
MALPCSCSASPTVTLKFALALQCNFVVNGSFLFSALQHPEPATRPSRCGIHKMFRFWLPTSLNSVRTCTRTLWRVPVLYTLHMTSTLEFVSSYPCRDAALQFLPCARAFIIVLFMISLNLCIDSLLAVMSAFVSR